MKHPPPQLRRQAPARRPRRRVSGAARRPVRPRRRLGRPARLILAGAGLIVAALAWAALARVFAPTGNSSAGHFDAIIVLGAAVDHDGNPSPALLARVTEAVHEYERGVAPRLIVTGGPDGHSVEADVMARTAQAEGVPPSALVLEPAAEDTIQNACFSARIMKAHGWNSAEIVTSPSHLPRAGLIFSRVPIAWRTHAAPPLAPQSAAAARGASAAEVLHTLYYLLYSNWAGRCSP